MPTSIGYGATSALDAPGAQPSAICTTSEITSGCSRSTPELLPDPTEELESLRVALAVAKDRYQKASEIADDVDRNNPEGPLALHRALHEYSDATTRYSEKLIERTNRILRADDGSS